MSPSAKVNTERARATTDEAPVIQSTAQQLPAEVVSRIFKYVAQDEDVDEWQWGGELIGWSSNERAAPLALVCKAWSAHASLLLYSSVALEGQEAALAFLRVPAQRLKLVSSAVVGVGGDLEEEQDGSLGQATASHAIMEVLEACSNLERLQIRPLHISAAAEVCSFLHRAPNLRSLVLTGRIVLPVPTWTQGLFDYLSWPKLLKRLRQLDIDWQQESSPMSYRLSGPSPLYLPPNHLTHLNLRIDVPEEVINRVLKASASTLRVLRIYLERSPRAFEATSQALSSLKNLRRLHYISNPPLLRSFVAPRPILDDVLPHLLCLTHLTTTATELSSSVFTTMPPSLRHLHVRCLSPLGLAYDSPLTEPVRTLAHHLESLTWEDSQERWSGPEKEALEKSCNERGVTLIFVEDDEGALNSDEVSPGAWRLEVDTDSSEELVTE